MAWSTNFASLGGANQPLSLLDTMFQQVAAMVAIPCTATGTNSITLAPIGNAPSSANLGSYSNFNTFSFLASATTTGAVSAQFGSLANLPVYRADGSTQATTGDLVSGRPYMLMYASTLNSGGGGFYLLRPALQPSGGQATQQVLLSGSSATYTTPANCLQLRIRMIGGGGGGEGLATNGGNGGNTTFGTVTANGGSGGAGTSSAPGGTGGAGAATMRLPGGPGGVGTGVPGGSGGNGPFGGAGQAGTSGATNTGAGGGSFSGTNPSTLVGGGGAGEYVELVINNPTATYTYTVGAAGAVGTGGSGIIGAGAAGCIYVEERYQD